MDYKTIDWNAEAARISRAFGIQWFNGVEFPCRFVEKLKEASPFHPEVPRPLYRELTWENGQTFYGFANESALACGPFSVRVQPEERHDLRCR